MNDDLTSCDHQLHCSTDRVQKPCLHFLCCPINHVHESHVHKSQLYIHFSLKHFSFQKHRFSLFYPQTHTLTHTHCGAETLQLCTKTESLFSGGLWAQCLPGLKFQCRVSDPREKFKGHEAVGRGWLRCCKSCMWCSQHFNTRGSSPGPT